MQIGDKKSIWVTGLKVIGEVIKIDKYFTTFKHQPVKWGKDVYTVSHVSNTRLNNSLERV